MKFFKQKALNPNNIDLDKNKAFFKTPKNKTNQQQKRIYCDPYSIKAQPSFFKQKAVMPF